MPSAIRKLREPRTTPHPAWEWYMQLITAEPNYFDTVPRDIYRLLREYFKDEPVHHQLAMLHLNAFTRKFYEKLAITVDKSGYDSHRAPAASVHATFGTLPSPKHSGDWKMLCKWTGSHLVVSYENAIYVYTCDVNFALNLLHKYDVEHTDLLYIGDGCFHVYCGHKETSPGEYTTGINYELVIGDPQLKDFPTSVFCRRGRIILPCGLSLWNNTLYSRLRPDTCTNPGPRYGNNMLDDLGQDADVPYRILMLSPYSPSSLLVWITK